MKCVTRAACGALAGLIFMIPLSSIALDDQKGKPRRHVVEAQHQRSAAAADMPVYKPPQRGTPGGRVGGSAAGQKIDYPCCPYSHQTIPA